MTPDTAHSKPALPKAAWAIFAVFFFESSVLGQWIPRIPDIKDGLGLSDAQLGLALLSMPIGTLVGFAVAGRLIEALGLRSTCQASLPVWALLFITPALAGNLPQLMFTLALCGMAVGIIETAMNTEAARIEKGAGRRLMSRCHGFWSLGTMMGALLGGLIAQQGVGVKMHFVMVMPLIAVGGYFAATALPLVAKTVLQNDERAGANSSAASSSEPEKGLINLPHRAILLLCIMPLGIMMVEGAFIDWSAVFMRDVMAASPLLIAVTYSFFSIVMAGVRLCGDAITDRVGELMVVRVSGLAAAMGVGIFAMAPSTLWVFIGAAIAGAGVAIVFPLAVTAAANRPGRSAADNVASLNMISFSAFFFAPPIIGFLSDAVGLRYALFALVPMAFATFLLAAEVSPKQD